MDVKAYIESGVLESYIMGLATAEEIKQVRQYAALYPEINLELKTIEETLTSYAIAQSKQPPAQLKSKIFDAINSGADSSIKHAAKIFEINNSLKNTSRFNYWAAASAGLLILSLAGNYFLYDKWRTAEQNVVALNNEKIMLAQQMQVQQTNTGVLNTEIAVLKNPYNKIIALKSLPASSLRQDMLATIFWNQQTREVFINVNSLPVPPAGKQYQLWALADGKPLDAGVFEMSSTSGLQKMKSIETAQAFAITLEQKGGSATPTLEAMYVMGGI